MTETVPFLCGSVAATSSPLGVKLHDAGYAALGLPFKYVAIGTTNLESVVKAVKALNFRGFGVSMPFKQAIIPFLDEVTPEVSAIGACNTVVVRDGRLVGHNTDWQGALSALDEAGGLSIRTAVIVGSGGVARAIAYGLKQKNIEVFVAARSEEKRKQLVKDLKLSGEDSIENQGKFRAQLVINATPLADLPNVPVNLSFHTNGEVLLDVVFQKKQTPLVKAASEQGWRVAPGWRMLLHQALRQFELYTEKKPPVSVMERVLAEALP